MAGTSKEAENMKQLALPVWRQRFPDFSAYVRAVTVVATWRGLFSVGAKLVFALGWLGDHEDLPYMGRTHLQSAIARAAKNPRFY